MRTTVYVVVAVAHLAGDRLPRRLVRGAARRPLEDGPLLVALVLPFWISYLMRMFAWTNLLDTDGYAARALDVLLDRLAAARRSGCSSPAAGSAGST